MLFHTKVFDRGNLHKTEQVLVATFCSHYGPLTEAAKQNNLKTTST